MRVVVMPATFVSAGWGTPTVCARHDLPAAETRPVTFRSLVPGWAYLLVLAPIWMMLVALFAQKRVKAPAWPFCHRCRSLLTLRRAITLTVFAAAVTCGVLFGTVFRGGLLLLIAILLLIASAVALRMSRPARVAKGYATGDAVSVEFRNPTPQFVQQVTDAKQAAARYHAQQTGVVIPQP